MATRVSTAFERFDQAELRFCRYLNRSSGFVAVRDFFALVSWLGNGKFWYALALLFPLIYDSWQASVHMVLTGTAGVLIYKLIKQHAVRERPFITHPAINCAAAPLDRYSFPSGHTLHAVSFTWIALSYYPEWVVLLLPFTLCVALSRVILGLHYPTDVAAGALLGAVIGSVSLAIAPV